MNNLKILFLQLWSDFYGGVETVNDTLVKQFNIDGNDAQILCMWSTGKKEEVKSTDYKKEVISEYPIRESYKKIANKLKKMDIKFVAKGIIKNIKFYFKKANHYSKFYKKIKKINPEFIIVSNIELIKYIPKKYLKKCVMHMHSGVDYYFYKESKKLLKLIKKYQYKILKLIWLSPQLNELAISKGLTNSTYMYNPVKYKSDYISSLDLNKITFIGRFAEEKRPWILTNIFNKMDNKDWNLELYGSGDETKLSITPNIKIMGPTSNVKEVLLNSSLLALTSKREGFPMVILEAYECGVPVIAFDFGISSKEIIVDGKTGFIVNLDNEDEYLEKLKLFCSDHKLRKKMGIESKRFVKNFYPEIVVKRWYKLFRGGL